MTDETIESELGPRTARANSWEEVNSITGGLRDVSVDLIVRGRIDSEYELPPTGKCGRLGCETEHGWGYIFAIPGMRYVNIGNCCADKYAPEAMRLIKRAFSDWKDERARETSHRQMIEEAREKADWLELIKSDAVRGTALKNSFLQEFRGIVALDITKRAVNNQPRVERQVSVSASAQETQRAMLQGGRIDVVEANIRVSRFEVHHIGDLRGLGIFQPLRDPVSQWTRFKTLVSMIIGSADRPQDPDGMRSLQRARRDFGPQSNDVAASLKAVEDFFSEKNLEIVKQMPLNRGQSIERIDVIGSEIRVLRHIR